MHYTYIGSLALPHRPNDDRVGQGKRRWGQSLDGHGLAAVEGDHIFREGLCR